MTMCNRRLGLLRRIRSVRVRSGGLLLIDLDKLAPDECAAVAASLEAAAGELKSR